MFKVKTLAVLFPSYPREVKTNTAKFKSAVILSLAFSMEMVQPIPTRALSHTRGVSMRTHLTGVVQRSRFLVLTKRSAASGDENGAVSAIHYSTLQGGRLQQATVSPNSAKE